MFTKNIQLKYNDNLIKNYIKSEDYDEILNVIDKVYQSDPEMLATLLKSNLFKMLNSQQSQRIFPENIIWINSFQISDAHLVSTFLTFYLDRINFDFKSLDNYADIMLNLFDELNFEGDVTFEEQRDFSYVYQYLISKKYKNKSLLIHSDLPFFESYLGRYFTHYYLSRCYFYIVKNPILILQEIKKQNPEYNTQAALNVMLNSDAHPNMIKSPINNRFFVSNKQGWHTNVHSWSNRNVLDTFRGFVIKLEDLIENPQDIFADMIGHLIQTGLDIKLDYDVITSFIENNNSLFDLNLVPEEISKKDAKIIERDIGSFLNIVKYKI